MSGKRAIGRIIGATILTLFSVAAAGVEQNNRMPSDFVDLQAIDPTIVVDIRYATTMNFTGGHVPAYLANKCLITQSAGDALSGIKKELTPVGLSLKLLDCYRPQQAVDYFVKWAVAGESSTKQQYYPRVPKAELITKGYIASPSSHSRGSTVDITIVSTRRDRTSGNELSTCGGALGVSALDMGTGYDCFDELAHSHNEELSAQQRANRMLLSILLVRAGFNPYAKEWWHFTLKNEPYPGTYFDFDVK